MFNFDIHQHEDLIDLDIPIDHQELEKVDFNWIQYNPRKPINRWGCSITSLDGSDIGIPDLDSLLEYNKINNTEYSEKDFSVKTKHSSPFQHFLREFQVGRSHFIKLGEAGYFPWHRDSDGQTFRIIYTLKSCHPFNLIWIEDDRILPLNNNRWYYINTKKKHAVFSFAECIFTVFNVLYTPQNVKTLKKYFVIK
jgi:hypothetical protein